MTTHMGFRDQCHFWGFLQIRFCSITFCYTCYACSPYYCKDIFSVALYSVVHCFVYMIFSRNSVRNLMVELNTFIMIKADSLPGILLVIIFIMLHYLTNLIPCWFSLSAPGDFHFLRCSFPTHNLLKNFTAC